jgi:apolipoprotein N-acyltransferase
LKRYAGACALGAITVGGFAPFNLFTLPVLTLAILISLAERRSYWPEAFRLGFFFGIGHFLAGVSWVYISLHNFGAMPVAAAAAVTLLFCAYLALFPAVALAVSAGIASPVVRRLLVFPAAWVLTEWLRGWLFTGFPWLALGYSQAGKRTVAGIAPIAGVYGIGLAAAFSAGLLLHAFAEGWRRPSWRPLAALVALWVGAGALRTIGWTEPVGEPLRVSLLQGNIEQSMKWRPEQVVKTLSLYRSMIEAAHGQLIILPETALPLFLQEIPRGFLEGIAQHARERSADVLVGVPERGEGRRYFNSVISVGSAPMQRYRKSHLVPFGEFIPLRPLLAQIVESLAIPLTDFGRGDADQRPLTVAGQRVAVNICYEDAFGEEIIRQLPEATLLVNVSNVAWFGDSIAPMQHLQIAQMRALETGRPMLRATNTGMTAIVGVHGNVVAAAARFENETLEAEVRGYRGTTPYVRFGNVPTIALAMILLIIVGIARFRSRI